MNLAFYAYVPPEKEQNQIYAVKRSEHWDVFLRFYDGRVQSMTADAPVPSDWSQAVLLKEKCKPLQAEVYALLWSKQLNKEHIEWTKSVPREIWESICDDVKLLLPQILQPKLPEKRYNSWRRLELCDGTVVFFIHRADFVVYMLKYFCQTDIFIDMIGQTPDGSADYYAQLLRTMKESVNGLLEAKDGITMVDYGITDLHYGTNAIRLEDNVWYAPANLRRQPSEFLVQWFAAMYFHRQLRAKKIPDAIENYVP